LEMDRTPESRIFFFGKMKSCMAKNFFFARLIFF